MDNMLPHFNGNRRLFRSYEPFMSSVVIKSSSESPQSWKLNRLLFQKMAKPLLQKSKHLAHADGWLPYYPWYINFFVYGPVWFWRYMGYKFKFITGNQGPWNDWDLSLKSQAWDSATKAFSENSSIPKHTFNMPIAELFGGGSLSAKQKVNLLQALYQTTKRVSYVKTG
jgi:hypothetical protein